MKKRRSHTSSLNKEATLPKQVEVASHPSRKNRSKKSSKKKHLRKTELKEAPSKEQQSKGSALPANRPPLHLSRATPAEARSEYLHRVAKEHRTLRLFTPSLPQAHTSSTMPQPPYSTANQSPSAIEHEHTTVTHKSPPFEHLPLQALLRVAESVSIGDGRYLQREFEQNNIDREGLIKVLEAHAKGRDVQKEYQHQADRFRTLKTTSPEFLYSQQAETSTQTLQENQPISKAEEPLSTHQTEAKNTTQVITSKRPSLRLRVFSWLAIGLIACAILVTILMFAMR